MNYPATQGKLISARKAQARLDLCPTTVWKLEKQGLLKGVSVYGKKYFTVQSIERFEDRLGRRVRPCSARRSSMANQV